MAPPLERAQQHFEKGRGRTRKLSPTKKKQMHLQPNQKLFGYPALEIRRLMRECGFACFSVGIVAMALRIKRPEALRLARALIDEGLMRDMSINLANIMCKVIGESDRTRFYELTTKGHAVRMATARKPIRRATAQRLVSEFLKRVEEVNANPNLMFWIDEVIVFGSFIGNSPTLSDVDLAVSYVARTEDRTLSLSWAQQRVAHALANRRQFARFIDRLGWPQREIELQLRKGSTALHLHDLHEEGSFIRTLPHRRIYTRQLAKLHLNCPHYAHTMTV
jgi:hypothetical protein